MKTKKNLALFALTLGATALLAACGGSKSDSSQASSQRGFVIGEGRVFSVA